MVYHLRAYNSNHSRCSNSIFIRTINFHNTITTMLGLAKFLTTRERRRFESISTSWEFIPNTNPGIPREGSLRWHCVSCIQYNTPKTQDVGYYVDQTTRTCLNRCLCALCHHLVPDYTHRLPIIYHHGHPPIFHRQI